MRQMMTKMTWKCQACRPLETNDTMCPTATLTVSSLTPINLSHPALSPKVAPCTPLHSPRFAIRAWTLDHPRPTPSYMTTTRPTWQQPLDSATLALHGRDRLHSRLVFPQCHRFPIATWTRVALPQANRVKAWTSREHLQTQLCPAPFPTCSCPPHTTRPSLTRCPTNAKCGGHRGRTAMQTWTLEVGLRRMMMTMVFSDEWRSSLLLLPSSIYVNVSASYAVLQY